MSDLAPGFLVAAPPLGDPNFDRSVVLLAAHGSEGAFGWVINGREVMSMTELMQRVELDGPPPTLEGSVRLNRCGDLEHAVAAARAAARPGDVVLLSPATASYDQYSNYEERGEHFRQLAVGS